MMDKRFFEFCKQGKTTEAAQLLDEGVVSVLVKDLGYVRIYVTIENLLRILFTLITNLFISFFLM